MRIVILAALLVVLLSPLGVHSASAAKPNCPPAFMQHPLDHPMEGEHQMVGTMTDRNGDGYICVQHVSADEGIHVHIDNLYPVN